MQMLLLLFLRVKFNSSLNNPNPAAEPNVFDLYEISSRLFRVSYFQFVVCLQIHPRAGDIMNEKFD